MTLGLRGLCASDRAAIEGILRATDAFDEAEIAVALELVDEGEAEVADGYRFVVAELDGAVVGYSCHGLIPLSDGAFDLYWIAVDPTLQGHGIGRALMREVERRARAAGGRWVLLETAGKPSYAATRAFYLAIGYHEVARIPDFYRAGDDRITYGRRIDRS